MGFFSDIKDKIFNRHSPSTSDKTDVGSEMRDVPSVESITAQATPSSSSIPAPTQSSAPNAANPTVGSVSTSSAPVPNQGTSDVDVAVVLDQAVAESGQTLNWRTSIVDLMKAVGIDSSLSARKALAEELEFQGDTNDSASMNVWLHKQVLAKLAANGGRVPTDLLD